MIPHIGNNIQIKIINVHILGNATRFRFNEKSEISNRKTNNISFALKIEPVGSNEITNKNSKNNMSDNLFNEMDIKPPNGYFNKISSTIL